MVFPRTRLRHPLRHPRIPVVGRGVVPEHDERLVGSATTIVGRRCDAVEREEVRADVDVAIDLLMGAVCARHLRGLPETDEWIESCVDTVMEGLSRR